MKLAGSMVVAFVVGVAACGSFESTPGTDATDAGADGVAGDSGTEDSAPKPFCASFDPKGARVVLCRDFDGKDETAVESWNDVNDDGLGVSLSLDSSTSVSAPASFSARIEPNSPGCSYAGAWRELGMLPAMTHVSFDVRPGGTGTVASDGVTFFAIKFQSCNIVLSANDQRGLLYVQGTVDNLHDLVAAYPKPNLWTHMDLTIDRAQNSIDVAVDGKRALDNGPVKLIDSCAYDGVTFAIHAGMWCETSSPNAREARLDNIVVTGSP